MNGFFSIRQILEQNEAESLLIDKEGRAYFEYLNGDIEPFCGNTIFDIVPVRMIQ
jgi:hypothetical protein